jgi:hypothetical protein
VWKVHHRKNKYCIQWPTYTFSYTGDSCELAAQCFGNASAMLLYRRGPQRGILSSSCLGTRAYRDWSGWATWACICHGNNKCITNRLCNVQLQRDMFFVVDYFNPVLLHSKSSIPGQSIRTRIPVTLCFCKQMSIVYEKNLIMLGSTVIGNIKWSKYH